MRIAAYCRVSTDKEAQIESLQNQKRFFEDFAKKQGDTLVEIYADEGISGKQVKNRTRFVQMLEDAKLDLFDMVVVKDISRFARNTVDSLNAIRELRACRVEILFLSNNQTVLGNSEFMLTIFSALAQEESANLSKRVKFGLEVSAKKGKVPNCIYGYDRVDAQTLHIKPQEAQVVKEIFQLYAQEGLGTRRIACLLNERAIPTKQGADWSPKTIRRMLANPIYAGVLLNHKSETTDFLTGTKRERPKEDWFVHSRPEYQIVAPDLFERAQAVMQERQRRYQPSGGSPTGRYSARHPLSTLIRCGHCGYAFTRRVWSSRVRDHVFWHCAGNHSRTTAFCQNTLNLYEEELLARLQDYLTTQVGDRSAFEREVAGAAAKELAAGRGQENAAQMQAKLARLSMQLQRQKDLYTEDIISMEELKEQTKRLRESIKELQLQLDAHRRQEGPKQAEAFETAEGTPGPLELAGWDHEDFSQLLDQITVYADGLVRVTFKDFSASEKPDFPFVGG